ncbi:hypothetical protein, partial [Streptomyces anulatus]|uniref:hypothetical protein n=1 Tax=Streptomyces anulatus TaxID=1892 RepID=UPI001EF1CA2E
MREPAPAQRLGDGGGVAGQQQPDEGGVQPHLFAPQLRGPLPAHLEEGRGGRGDVAGVSRGHGGRRGQDEDGSGRRALRAVRVFPR